MDDNPVGNGRATAGILRPMHRMVLVFVLCPVLLPAQDRFERLMRDILIFDAHIDTPRYFVDEGYRLADGTATTSSTFRA